VSLGANIAIGLGLGAGLYFGWRLYKGAKVKSKPMSDFDATPPSTQPSLSPLDAALLAAGRDLVPAPSTILRPGDPALDVVYGGRLPDVFGAPAWGYYETKLAGGRSGGTTCGIVLAYLMARAGWPRGMINRLPSDPAPGVGFTPGWHVTRIVEGAKRRGWYLAPPAGPRVGDAYHVDHPPKPNSDHVGLVESVSPARADGTRTVTTIDGGQGTGADVQRQTRTLSADGRALTLNGVPARVLGWIRASASGEAIS
jgi:hypothetical protein